MTKRENQRRREREFNKFKEFLFSFNEEIPDELKNDITKDLLNLTDIFEEYEIKDYLPDFYLDDYNIYIEHFGLNRKQGGFRRIYKGCFRIS